MGPAPRRRGTAQISLYHSENGKLLGVLPFAEGMPEVLRFSRNGSLLLAAGGRGGQLGIAALYDVKTGKRVATVGEELDSVLAADVGADHSMIALGGPGKIVRVYSVETGEKLHEIKKHTDWICAIEFSPDGVLLATGDRSGGLFVWEAETAREYLSLRGHTAGINDVSWRIDSNLLASASDDTTVKLWEMNDGNAVKNWGRTCRRRACRQLCDEWQYRHRRQRQDREALEWRRRRNSHLSRVGGRHAERRRDQRWQSSRRG